MIPSQSLVNDEYRKYFWSIFIEKNRHKFIEKNKKSGFHFLLENKENWFLFGLIKNLIIFRTNGIEDDDLKELLSIVTIMNIYDKKF